MELFGVKEVINSWACRQKRLDKIGAMSMAKQCRVNMKLPSNEAAESVTTDNIYYVLTYRINVYNTN
jgi:hypothetical protein